MFHHRLDRFWSCRPGPPGGPSSRGPRLLPPRLFGPPSRLSLSSLLPPGTPLMSPFMLAGAGGGAGGPPNALSCCPGIPPEGLPSLLLGALESRPSRDSRSRSRSRPCPLPSPPRLRLSLWLSRSPLSLRRPLSSRIAPFRRDVSPLCLMALSAASRLGLRLLLLPCLLLPLLPSSLEPLALLRREDLCSSLPGAPGRSTRSARVSGLVDKIGGAIGCGGNVCGGPVIGDWGAEPCCDPPATLPRPRTEVLTAPRGACGSCSTPLMRPTAERLRTLPPAAAGPVGGNRPVGDGAGMLV